MISASQKQEASAVEQPCPLSRFTSGRGAGHTRPNTSGSQSSRTIGTKPSSAMYNVFCTFGHVCVCVTLLHIYICMYVLKFSLPITVSFFISGAYSDVSCS